MITAAQTSGKYKSTHLQPMTFSEGSKNIHWEKYNLYRMVLGKLDMKDETIFLLLITHTKSHFKTERLKCKI